MSMFEFVCKKSHFLRQSVKLIVKSLPRFTCRTNWDSESGSEITPELVLTPQIQWMSQT